MKTTKFVASTLLLVFLCNQDISLAQKETSQEKESLEKVYSLPLVKTLESGEQEIELQQVLPPPMTGTFYSLQMKHPPMPLAPAAEFELPIYFWSDGIFLFDDLEWNYADKQAAGISLFNTRNFGTQAKGGAPLAMSDGPPVPGGGGGGGETNECPDYLAPDYGTNLWLSIVDATNSVLLTLHNTQEGQEYNILSKTNLNQTNWIGEQTVYGPAGTNIFSTSVSKSGRDSVFFMLSAPTMSRVQTPFFDPISGNYIASQNVTFFDATAGATIRYTTNGVTPTTNDAVIASGAFLTVTNTTQFKAKAWKSGMLPSDVASADYTIHLAAPEFSPAGGIYAVGQEVEILCASGGATIYYTTNGVDPTTNSATIASGSKITLNSSITLKAKAWKGGQESGISSMGYQIRSGPLNDDVADAQIISGTSGTVLGSTIGATSEDGEYMASSIWYEWTAPTNGSVLFELSATDFYAYLSVFDGVDWDGTLMGTEYIYDGSSVAFAATSETTYKIALHSGQGNGILNWTMEEQVATPTFSPEGGTFDTNQLITVGCATANAIIHYTLNGNDPTESDPAIFPGDNLELNASYTLKAKAWRSGLAASAVQSSSYIIDTNATNLTLVVDKPVFDPPSTNFSSNILVTVSCTTTGATIYYTTNGFEPTTNDAVIASGSTVTVTNTQVLKAKAWKSGSNASGIQTAVYAKGGQDSDFDGIPDEWELWHGSDIFLPDAHQTSSEEFAHGLNNMQVFNFPSVLIADNYSTANDGIPDWWKIKNGMSISDPAGANIIGRNGMTALQSYNGGFDFNDVNKRPGTLPKVDFKMVRGPENNIYLKVDTILPNIVKYELYFIVSWSYATNLPASFLDYKVNMVEFTPSSGNPDNVFQVPPSLIFGHETYYNFGLKAVDQEGHVSEENWPGTGFLRYLHDYADAMVTNYMPMNEEKLKWQMRFRMAAPPNELPRHTDFVDFGVSYAHVPTETDLWYEEDWNEPFFLYPMNPTWVDLGKFHSAFGGISGWSDPSIYNLGIILTNFGLTKYTTNTQTFARMTGGKTNYHGLEYLGYTLESLTNAAQLTVTPSADVNITSLQPDYRIYSNVEQPDFWPVEYYFGGTNLGVGDFNNANGVPPSPELPAHWTLGKTNPILVASVRSTYFVDAWAKLEIYRPGASTPVADRYGYLQQYWDKAYLCGTNSDVPRTTEDNIVGKKKIDTTAAANMQTGILSPLGEFTPTKAGKVILTTKPDANGFYGECVVHVIDLKVDLNRDGKMDAADFTSDVRPFRFWVNDDDDLGETDGKDISLTAPYQNNGPANWQGNAAYFGINGVRDLVDFFPIVLDVGSLIQALPPSATVQYKLKQADGAVNIAYTALQTNVFLSYLTNTTTAQSLGATQTVWIKPTGVPLSTSFLTNIPAQGRGVILVEGRKPTKQPLVLEIWDGANLVGQTELHLNISRVEEMFRHKNLTGAVSPSLKDGPEDRLALSLVPNEPDTSEKDFVFLHGYNVNPESARGWSSEMFKRMYWSGSRAKFYSVTWRAYEGQIETPVFTLTPNLQTNIVNAFLTAPQLTTFLATLTNETIVAGHSLGNMATLSALNDWNARIDKFFMIDAAVAIEAVQGDASQNANMYHPDWHDYATRLTATEWHNLFPTNDYRSTLTWRDRLANFQNVEVHNFYSSGEEILRMHEGMPPDIAGYLIEEFAGFWDDLPPGTYSWALQEKMKGRLLGNAIFGSNHGGWGFNLNPPYYNFTNGQYVLMPNSQASLLPDSQLRTNAFFNKNMDGAVFGTNGSAYAQANRNRMIADAIPATTLPVGANPIPKLSPPVGENRNFDMNESSVRNGWPSDRTDDEARWRHSDVREVAYLFTFRLFNEFVNRGDLK